MAASYDQIIAFVAIDVAYAEVESERSGVSGIGQRRPLADIDGAANDLGLNPLIAMLPDLNSIRCRHQQQRPVAASLHRQRKVPHIPVFLRNDRRLFDDLSESGSGSSNGETKFAHS